MEEWRNPARGSRILSLSSDVAPCKVFPSSPPGFLAFLYFQVLSKTLGIKKEGKRRFILKDANFWAYN